MSIKSKIEWTNASWNPIRGCTKLSEGCKNCYAQTFAERFRGVPGHPYEQGFDLRIITKKINEPLKWKKPRKIFVCSMSDLFHEKVPIEYIIKVFETMNKASWHTFQILTKRTERLLKIHKQLNWTSNIWIGTTIELEKYSDRANILSKIPASVRFLSLEPLLGPIQNLPLNKIDWIIVGGESGLNARPMDLDWALTIKEICQANQITFFFKQFGGKNNKRGGDQALLEGQIWHQYPKGIYE
jgi:protein gp37